MRDPYEELFDFDDSGKLDVIEATMMHNFIKQHEDNVKRQAQERKEAKIQAEKAMFHSSSYVPSAGMSDPAEEEEYDPAYENAFEDD